MLINVINNRFQLGGGDFIVTQYIYIEKIYIVVFSVFPSTFSVNCVSWTI